LYDNCGVYKLVLIDMLLSTSKWVLLLRSATLINADVKVEPLVVRKLVYYTS
jgi:hypothetical protein